MYLDNEKVLKNDEEKISNQNCSHISYKSECISQFNTSFDIWVTNVKTYMRYFLVFLLFAFVQTGDSYFHYHWRTFDDRLQKIKDIVHEVNEAKTRLPITPIPLKKVKS